MSSLRLIVASLLYHWRMNLAVACGVAAATAVLSGALLVGDSMRGSLRELTLRRLGPIDEVLLTKHFFRQKLADELAGEPEFRKRFAAAVPAIILRASLENTDQEDRKRANRVNLIGCDSRFWQLGSGQSHELARSQIVLNQPLADRLGVLKTGQDVILHLPDLGTIPGDSPLGKKTDTVKRPRLTVTAIIPTEGPRRWPGRFSLRPNQQLPLNAYVSIGGLQNRLDRTGRVNAVLVAGKDGDTDAPPQGRDEDELEESHNALKPLLTPTPTDYGIRIAENEPDLPAPQRGEFRYINITSDRMLLEPAVDEAIRRTLEEEGAQFQPVFTYLANAIDVQKHDPIPEEQDDDGKLLPYSTITAIDFAQTHPLGPFLTRQGDPIGPLDDRRGKSIVLNSWAAEDLGVKR
ncbi:MAG: ABC transporter permease, partial [Planctomycetota bacterium]